MNEQILLNYYAIRGFSEQMADDAVKAVRELEAFLSDFSETLTAVEIPLIRDHIRALIRQNRNSPDALRALARYFYLTRRNEIYVYFTSLLGGIGVIDSIRDRLGELENPETARALFDTLPQPPLGSDPADYPAFTRALIERLEANLPEDTVRRTLAGNHHQIPAKAFQDDVALYRSSLTMDDFLRAKHAREVATLQRHCDEGTVWYEQMITQDVVDFVAANQEIQSAVLEGDTLYTTKIPYDPVRYLAETDETMRRYYACHCPFVREVIRRGENSISENWCYCSGGFVKYPFEVILGRKLRVELLQSVLKGDPVCRFAIHLHEAE